MQWKDICKEVAVSYKRRNWMLVRTPKSVVDRAEPGLSVSGQYQGMSLILDCSLDQMFELLEQLGPGISYTAALTSPRLYERNSSNAERKSAGPFLAFGLAC
ncbi:hypothetical protein EI534_02665 [Pseudomonas frederiksbergensis]|nr:hypothetical protein [Pseudomonas frederiksbergensis]